MELNLAPSVTHNILSTRSAYGRQLLEGFNPSVQLRETRSAYFINVNLSGFRKEDIKLEMDNSRTLIIRGQRILEDLGRVEWTWHLMESGGRSYRKPFKIPNNVNVGGISGSFHQGVLHVLMPKLKWTSRFTPYHINRFNSQDIHDHRHGCATAGPAIQEIANKVETNVAGEEASVDEEKEGFYDAQDMDHLVGTQRDTLKETEQTAPAISPVEEERTPPKSMEFGENCPSDIDPPKEIRNPHDDEQQIPLAEESEIQISLSSPALQQKDLACSASQGHMGSSEVGQKQPDAANEMAHRPEEKEDAEARKTDSSLKEINVEGSIALKEELGPPTTPAEEGYHEEQDGISKMAHGADEKKNAEVQQEDFPLQEKNLEVSISNKEESRPPKTVAEESDHKELDDLQKLSTSKEKDEGDETCDNLNLSAFFSSRRTKIILSVALSSVALITAYKLIRRRS